MILENPPAHDPQANEQAERALQEIKAQIKCLKLGLIFSDRRSSGQYIAHYGTDHLPRCRPDKQMFGGGGGPHSTISDPFRNI